MVKEDSVITLEKLSISEDDIRKMSAETKRQYLMFTIMLRDLDLLRKLLVFVKPDESGEEISKAIFVTKSLFVVKILVGKMHEINDFIKDIGILNQKNSYSQELTSKLEKIEESFSDNKTADILAFIRDKFAFHYDTWQDIVEPINDAMKEHKEIECWLCSTDAGNDIFSSSNTIILEIILQRMRKNGFEGDEDVLLGNLLKLIINISFHLREFCITYLSEVILNGIKFEPRGKIQVRVPRLSEVNLPLLVKNDLAK